MLPPIALLVSALPWESIPVLPEAWIARKVRAAFLYADEPIAGRSVSLSDTSDSLNESALEVFFEEWRDEWISA